MKKIAIIFIALFFISTMFCNNIVAQVVHVRRTSNREIDIKNDKSLKLNDKSLYREIKNKGILYPDIAFSQALLESNHYKSKLAKINKNLFGMTVSEKRQNVTTGKRSGYATYIDWTKSVEDYKLWQDNIPDKYKSSKEKYYTYIQRHYSHTNTYCKMVRKIVKYYNPFFVSVGISEIESESKIDSSLQNSFDSVYFNSFILTTKGS